MRAAVCSRYGPPEALQVMEVDRPVPKDDEVLVRVRAACINKADWIMIRGKPFAVRLMGPGLFKPKNEIPGSDVAGQVEAVGRNVKEFHPGDKVFGDLFEFGQGGYAEYACASEDAFSTMPENITFEEAAAVPMAAITALQAIRDEGKIQSGQKVLIYGASGGVGTFAVQIAKWFGAEVTAVCSTRNLDIARSLGADHIIDYTKEDFTKNGQYYDLIIGVNGYRSIFNYKRALNPEGVYVMVGGRGPQLVQAMLLGPLISATGSRKVRSVSAMLNKKNMDFMGELLNTGKVVSVIDRRYPLDEVDKAFRYFEDGQARGKLVITLDQNSKS